MSKQRVVVFLDIEGGAAQRTIQNTERNMHSLGRAESKTRDGFAKLKGVIGAAFAGAVLSRIVAFGREMFTVGSAVEETASKFSTVFGPAASGLDADLRRVANAMGLTQREARDLTATNGAVLQGMEFGQEASADYSLRLLKLSADLASFNNVQGGAEEVSQALTSALTGEREGLKRLGIVISEEEVKQKQAALAAEGHADALGTQGKAAATLELITEKAGVAVGDLARTQDGAANQARAHAAAIREQRETFARLLLPALSLVLDSTGELITENRRAADTLAVKLARAALYAAGAVRAGVTATGQFIRALAGLGKTVGTVAGSGGPLSAFEYVVEGAIRDLENGAIRALQFDKALATLGIGFAKLKGVLGIEDTTAEVKQLQKAVEDANQGLRDIRGGRRRRERGGGVFGEGFQESLSEFEQLADELGSLPELGAEVANSLRDLENINAGGSSDSLRRLADDARAVRDGAEKAAATVARLTRVPTPDFKDAIAALRAYRKIVGAPITISAEEDVAPAIEAARTALAELAAPTLAILAEDATAPAVTRAKAALAAIRPVEVPVTASDETRAGLARVRDSLATVADLDAVAIAADPAAALAAFREVALAADALPKEARTLLSVDNSDALASVGAARKAIATLGADGIRAQGLADLQATLLDVAALAEIDLDADPSRAEEVLARLFRLLSTIRGTAVLDADDTAARQVLDALEARIAGVTGADSELGTLRFSLAPKGASDLSEVLPEASAGAASEIAAELRLGLLKSIDDTNEALRTLRQLYDAATDPGQRERLAGLIGEVERFRDSVTEAKDVTLDLGAVSEQVLEGLAADIAQTVGEFATGVSEYGTLTEAIGVTVLGTLADIAIQVGKTAIATGIAVAGIRQALTTLNPFAAIAAGAALIALGSFVKSSLGKSARGDAVPTSAPSADTSPSSSSPSGSGSAGLYVPQPGGALAGPSGPAPDRFLGTQPPSQPVVHVGGTSVHVEPPAQEFRLFLDGEEVTARVEAVHHQQARTRYNGQGL